MANTQQGATAPNAVPYPHINPIQTKRGLARRKYGRCLSAMESQTIYQALELIKKTMITDRVQLTNPKAVSDYLQLDLVFEEREVFVCLWLDAQNRLIDTETMFAGTLTQTSVYPREIVKTALHHNAAAVIFAHNHPSGITSPSSADIRLTQVLKTALSMMDIKVLDHFIVGGNEPFSMAENNYSPFGPVEADEVKPPPQKALPAAIKARKKVRQRA